MADKTPDRPAAGTGPSAAPPECRLCGGQTALRRAYGVQFAECADCGFVFRVAYNQVEQSAGMGMRGGVGGGHREYWLARMLHDRLGLQCFLLFGTGNSPTLGTLREEGLDVIGCDISQELVAARKDAYGDDAFYTPDELPAERQFDGIIAVEVIEHFAEPRVSMGKIMLHLSPQGVFCGTTDFYLDGAIEEPCNYMKPWTHVAYWSTRSMAYAARLYSRASSFFKMLNPGIMPSLVSGKRWMNKRVFFLYDRAAHGEFFRRLEEEQPTLPIVRP